MRKFIHQLFDPFWLAITVVIDGIISLIDHLSNLWFFCLILVCFAGRLVYVGFKVIHEATGDKSETKE